MLQKFKFCCVANLMMTDDLTM